MEHRDLAFFLTIIQIFIMSAAIYDCETINTWTCCLVVSARRPARMVKDFAFSMQYVKGFIPMDVHTKFFLSLLSLNLI